MTVSSRSKALPRSFYDRPAIEVARGLLGKTLWHGNVSGTIVETEAYLGLEDRASHAWRGITPRTKVIFGPPGYAYVYLIYGIYECLNIVAEKEGSPGCVLIRGLEPLTGLPAMRKRRPGAKDSDLANGPGKLTLAMAITRRHNGADVTKGPLVVCEPAIEEKFEIGVSPRIGLTHCKDWPLRFFVQK